MSGLSPLAGVGPLIFIGGRELQIRGRTLRHICEVDAQIQYLRGDPVAACRAAVAMCPEGTDKKALSIRLIKSVRHRWSSATTLDISTWCSTTEGRIFCLWQALRHEGVTRQWVEDAAFESMEREGEVWLYRIMSLVEMATSGSEADRLGNIRNAGDKAESAAVESQFPNYDFIFSMLTKEPFSMSRDEILDLTIYQLNIICRPKDGNFGDDRLSELGVFDIASGMARRATQKVWDASYEKFAENLASGRNLMHGLTS